MLCSCLPASCACKHLLVLAQSALGSRKGKASGVGLDTDLMGLRLFSRCQVKNALAACSVSLFPERDEPRIKEQSTNPLFYERGTQGRRVGLRKQDVKLPRSSSN